MKKIAVVLIPLLVLGLVFGAIGCSCTKTVYVTPTPTPTLAPTPTPTEAPPTPSPSPTVAPATPTPTPIPGPTAGDPNNRPCSFYGSVILNGVNAPAGTVVMAIVAGYSYTTTTTIVSGAPHYYIKVYKAPGVIFEGQTVTFIVNGVPAAQTSTWTEGSNKLKNLTAP